MRSASHGERRRPRVVGIDQCCDAHGAPEGLLGRSLKAQRWLAPRCRGPGGDAMRYRDQPTVEVEERVVGDPRGSGSWSPTSSCRPALLGVSSSRSSGSTGRDGVAVGNRFRGNNRNPILGEWSTGARWSRWSPAPLGVDGERRRATDGDVGVRGRPRAGGRHRPAVGPHGSRSLGPQHRHRPRCPTRKAGSSLVAWPSGARTWPANLAGIKAIVEGGDGSAGLIGGAAGRQRSGCRMAAPIRPTLDR